MKSYLEPFIIFFIPDKIYSQGKLNLLAGMDISENRFWHAQQRKVLQTSESGDMFAIFNFHGGIQYIPFK